MYNLLAFPKVQFYDEENSGFDPKDPSNSKSLILQLTWSLVASVNVEFIFCLRFFPPKDSLELDSLERKQEANPMVPLRGN